MSDPAINAQESFEEKHLLDYYRKIGSETWVESGVVWNSIGFKIFRPTPPFKEISLSCEDLRSIWNRGALFLHYFTSDNCCYTPGWILLVQDRNYNVDSIQSPKRRHNIRWALKRSAIEPISIDFLKKVGHLHLEDTCNRQGRPFGEAMLQEWKEYLHAIENNPLFEAWGIFNSGELASFQVYYSSGGGRHIDVTYSRTHLLKNHPVDALVYAYTYNAMSREEVAYVSYGRRPLIGEKSSLVSFKESMGFKQVPMKERLEVNPRIKAAFFGQLKSVYGLVAKTFSARSVKCQLMSGVCETLCHQVK